jgi:hypothetical protein
LAIITLSTASNYYEITAELTNFTNRQSVLKLFIAAFASWPASYIAGRLKALPGLSLERRLPPERKHPPRKPPGLRNGCHDPSTQDLVGYSNSCFARRLFPKHPQCTRSPPDRKEKKESRPSRVGSPEEDNEMGPENAVFQNPSSLTPNLPQGRQVVSSISRRVTGNWLVHGSSKSSARSACLRFLRSQT